MFVFGGHLQKYVYILCSLLMGMCKSMPLYCVRCWWKCVNVCLYIALAVAGYVSKYVRREVDTHFPVLRAPSFEKLVQQKRHTFFL